MKYVLYKYAPNSINKKFTGYVYQYVSGVIFKGNITLSFKNNLEVKSITSGENDMKAGFKFTPNSDCIWRNVDDVYEKLINFKKELKRLKYAYTDVTNVITRFEKGMYPTKKEFAWLNNEYRAMKKLETKRKYHK